MRILRVCAAAFLVVLGWNTRVVAGEESAHPRLLFGPEDIPRLRDRIHREPYARHYRDFLNWLERGTKAPQPELDPILIRTQIGGLVSILKDDPSFARAARRPYLERIRSWGRELPGYQRDPRKDSISLFVSRELPNMCIDFDLLQSFSVFSREEETEIQQMLGIAAERLMELGTSFNPYDYTEERFRLDNWNTDRLIGVGMFALAFPEDRRSAAWRQQVLGELDWQLDNVLMPGGFWPEGTRYHGAVLRSLIPFAYVLKRQGGKNLFEDRRVKALIASWIDLQTPPVAQAGNVALMPGINDANWENIWESVLAWAAPAYQDRDPGLAAKLMRAWRQAGSPFVVEFSPGNPGMGFLLIDDSMESAPPQALTSTVLPNEFVIFRHHPDDPDGSWLLFNTCVPQLDWQHHHYDRGSFSLIAGRTLLVADPGVGDYNETLWGWYARSMAHNGLTFSNSDNRNAVRLVDHALGGDVEYAATELRPADGIVHLRRVFFLKPHDYLIWDTVNGNQAATFNLHVLGNPVAATFSGPSVEASPERVTFRGANDIDLDVVILSPEHPREGSLMEIAQAAHPLTVYVERDTEPVASQQQFPRWLKLKQAASGQPFITVLSPRHGGASPLQVVRFERGAATEGGDGPLRASFAIEMESSNRRWTLYLNSQRTDRAVLRGDGAVITKDLATGRESAIACQATRFKSGSTFDFTSTQPATSILPAGPP